MTQLSADIKKQPQPLLRAARRYQRFTWMSLCTAGQPSNLDISEQAYRTALADITSIVKAMSQYEDRLPNACVTEHFPNVGCYADLWLASFRLRAYVIKVKRNQAESDAWLIALKPDAKSYLPLGTELAVQTDLHLISVHHQDVSRSLVCTHISADQSVTLRVAIPQATEVTLPTVDLFAFKAVAADSLAVA